MPRKKRAGPQKTIITNEDKRPAGPLAALQPFVGAVQRWRFLFLNLLQAALLWLYFQSLHPVFLDQLTRVYTTRRPNMIVGMVILSMYLLEITGMLLKISSFNRNTVTNPNLSRWGLAISGFTIMGVLAINAMPSFLLLPAFNLEKNTNLITTLATLGLLGLIFACWALPTALLGGQFEVISNMIAQRATAVKLPAAHKPPAAVKLPARDRQSPIDRKAFALESLGDLLLTLYGAMALTATWNFMLAISPRERLSPGYLAFMFILFVFIYLSSRAIYFVEEMLTRQPWYARLISFSITAAIATQALMLL